MAAPNRYICCLALAINKGSYKALKSIRRVLNDEPNPCTITCERKTDGYSFLRCTKCAGGNATTMPTVAQSDILDTPTRATLGDYAWEN